MRLLFAPLAATVLAGLAMAAPALAEQAAPPANAVVRGPNPAGVDDNADKLLWCGHAFIEAAPNAAAAGDAEGAAAMRRDGAAIIARGEAALAAGGFDAGAASTTSAGYADRVKTDLAGDGATARYAYDECLMLSPAGAALLGGGSIEAGGAPTAPPNDSDQQEGTHP